MTAAPLGPAITMSQIRPQPAAQYCAAANLSFIPAAGVHRWEEKAGFSFLYEYECRAHAAASACPDSISRDGIVDLTSKMDKDGTLHWDVPPGKWTILRMGYSLTGIKEPPAPGRRVWDTRWTSSAGKMWRHISTVTWIRSPCALGPLLGKSLRYMMMDSWEAGMQNWTDEMIGEFRKRPRIRSDALSAGTGRPRRRRTPTSATASSGISAARSPTCSPKIITARWTRCCISTAWASTPKRRASRWKSSRTRC